MARGKLVAESLGVLRRWLEDSRFSPGTHLPSERALANQLGVNHYSLNRAMARLLAEGLVHRQGNTLIYTPDREAQHRFKCELVIARSSFYLPTYVRLAKELNIELAVHPWHSVEETLVILKNLCTPGTQSVMFDPPFLYSMETWEPLAEQFAAKGIPLVCLGHEMRGACAVMKDVDQTFRMAMTHLTDLGHKEIAHVTSAGPSAYRKGALNTWRRVARDCGANPAEDRVVFVSRVGPQPEDLRDLARKFREEWSAVTGLVISAGNFPHDTMLEELAHGGRKVPQDLSVISSGESRSIANSSITYVNAEKTVLYEAAFMLLQRALRKRESTGTLCAPSTLRLVPEVMERSSTRALATPERRRPPKAKSDEAWKFQSHWTSDPTRMNKEMALSLQRQYPLALRAPVSRFQHADLSQHMNRPLHYRRGWLGGLPLAPVIHGVSFHLLGGKARSECGAVVFRSTVNTTGLARDLPTRLEIPVGGRVEAIYFLHGSGYTKHLHHFADYRFHTRQGEIGRVPLICLGQPDDDYEFGNSSPDLPQPNIQDWWPDVPHMDFPPHARMVPLLKDAEEHLSIRHDYLYTLEWVNPQPEEEITHIEVWVDENQATTLGLLAVSFLRFR
jgi:DNA-binding LacI/PurR family transcriptional regulator/DNA-binding transcriptional regulator YhcF (GntR family)